eukprot:TRINITY_DN1607_c2_g1_i1.p1 TRINITY_DN1607_c2_g1~~TRINITY_DN1607_c2_g1_i1.p1  ORF type:complete len:537 (-),score=78.38 TRINITY_DN1607_c2_g1_i1:1072-2682(-)
MGQATSSNIITFLEQDYFIGDTLAKDEYSKVYKIQHTKTLKWKVVKEIDKSKLRPIVNSSNNSNKNNNNNNNNHQQQQHHHQRYFQEVKNECIMWSHLNTNINNANNKTTQQQQKTHLPVVYARLQSDDALYILSNYYSGGDLNFLLKSKGKLKDESIKEILICLILSIHEIHQKKIIHRDIRPINILFDRKGYPSITNFKYSVYQDHVLQGNFSSSILDSYRICDSSKLSYTAPELLVNHPIPYTNKVDWWSLGVIAYHISHGKLPWQFPSYDDKKFDTPEKFYQTCLSIIKENDPSYSHSCSPHLNSLIQGLLTLDAESRFGIDELMNHTYFNGSSSWNLISRKVVPLHFVPSKETLNYNLNTKQSVMNLQKINTTITKSTTTTTTETSLSSLTDNDKNEETSITSKTDNEQENETIMIDNFFNNNDADCCWDYVSNNHLPYGLTNEEYDIIEFQNNQEWETGFQLFEGGDHLNPKGKVIFSLKDLDINTLFKTERGTIIERIDEYNIRLGDENDYFDNDNSNNTTILPLISTT